MVAVTVGSPQLNSSRADMAAYLRKRVPVIVICPQKVKVAPKVGRMGNMVTDIRLVAIEIVVDKPDVAAIAGVEQLYVGSHGPAAVVVFPGDAHIQAGVSRQQMPLMTVGAWVR